LIGGSFRGGSTAPLLALVSLCVAGVAACAQTAGPDAGELPSAARELLGTALLLDILVLVAILFIHACCAAHLHREAATHGLNARRWAWAGALLGFLALIIWLARHQERRRRPPKTNRRSR